MVLSLDRWVGKVAVITGASSGIGAAIAEQLVSNGLIVVGIARRVDRVEALSKKLSAKKGKLHPIKADIGNEQELLAALEQARKLGPIHILINNAGVFPQSSLTEEKTEVWRNVFDLNVLALSIATREVVKDFKKNKIDGHIIHVNSILGHLVTSSPFQGFYPASKYAVTALTETLRQELNHLGLKVKITSVSPGPVETEMTTVGDTPKAKALKERLTAILKAEDIADGVVYVLSTPPHVQVHELTIRPVGSLA